jgi:predicted dehydrogenase
VEKPLSADLYSALKLYHDDKGIQDIVLVGHHRLFSPIVDATCQVLEKKALGKIVCVRGSSKFFKPASYFEAQAWRVVEGGGPLNINFVHDIASMIRILGQISLVHAFSSNHARNFTVEDTAVVNMVFKNGVLGSFVISDCAMSTESWEQTSGENQYFWNDVDSDCYEISGTKASIKIPSMTFIGPSEGQPESWNSVVDKGIFAVSSEDPLERQLQHFIDVIQKKAKPRVSFRFGCEVVAVTHAIRHSISTGCAAEVPTLFL